MPRFREVVLQGVRGEVTEFPGDHTQITHSCSTSTPTFLTVLLQHKPPKAQMGGDKPVPLGEAHICSWRGKCCSKWYLCLSLCDWQEWPQVMGVVRSGGRRGRVRGGLTDLELMAGGAGVGMWVGAGSKSWAAGTDVKGHPWRSQLGGIKLQRKERKGRGPERSFHV